MKSPEASSNQRTFKNVKLTRRFRFQHLLLWVLVVACLIVLIDIAVFMLYQSLWQGEAPLGADPAGELAFRRTGLLVAMAVITGLFGTALAVLTVSTAHRIGGPYIALRRTLAAVREGDLSARLRFRKHDNLDDFEGAFNEMLDAINGRIMVKDKMPPMPGLVGGRPAPPVSSAEASPRQRDALPGAPPSQPGRSTRSARRGGFTLLETVASLMLIAMVAASVYSSVLMSRRLTYSSSHYVSAFGMAKAKLEEIRTLDYAELTATNFVNETGLRLSHLGGRNRNALTCTRSVSKTAATSPTRTEVTVTVTWRDQGRVVTEDVTGVLYPR